jgi:hypothetical protein
MRDIRVANAMQNALHMREIRVANAMYKTRWMRALHALHPTREARFIAFGQYCALHHKSPNIVNRANNVLSIQYFKGLHNFFYLRLVFSLKHQANLG